jgi:polar amino acid transport system substrate-binding protein
MRLKALVFATCLLVLAGGAQAQDASLVEALAPEGVLRASINLGNPVLASIDPQTGQPVGVSVDLAMELAKRLHVPLQMIPVRSAGASVDNVAADRADIGFFAVDPKRGQQIAFTSPYVLIEGYYLVRNDSPITTNAQVDRAGVTVAVGEGSAYDLFLTRELKQASIVRVQGSPAVVKTFLDRRLDVAAGVKQQLESDAAKTGGLRLLGERFMVIRQAMGVPKSRGAEAAEYVAQFVREMADSGFVAAALKRHGIEGAEVAKAGE